MLKGYISAALALLAIALGILIIDAAAVLACTLAGLGHSPAELISDVAFMEGGLILLLGAFLEFFHVKGTGKLSDLLLSPRKRFYKEPEPQNEEINAGWLLIFLGGALMLPSFYAPCRGPWPIRISPSASPTSR